MLLRSKAIPWNRTIGISSLVHQRSLTNTNPRSSVAEEQVNIDINGTFWEEYRNSFTIPAIALDSLHPWITLQPCNIGKRVTITGFLRNKKQLSKGLMFARISRGSSAEDGVQIMLKESSEGGKIGEIVKSIKEHSAVSVTGVLQYKVKKPNQTAGTMLKSLPVNGNENLADFEIHAEEVMAINSFPKDIIVGPAQKLAKSVREHLSSEGADEIETPILFKSTPEGAREFLVPTRNPGYAYALPQSPQQYKQILMASGVTKYFQFAKCFRDEDLRADRQPEFTQIDMEISWTDGQGVMQTVERLVKAMHDQISSGRIGMIGIPELPEKKQFPRMTYEEAMSKHGSDKPDLRIVDLIHRVDPILPASLKSMLTSIENPIIEACKFRLGGNPRKVQQFIRKFMDSADAEVFQKNPDGPPGIFVFDPKRPLEGLQAFGFEGAEALKHLYSSLPSSPHIEVNFDSHFTRPQYSKKLLAPIPGLHYLWVTDFPLFTLDTANPNDPGQGGRSGFSSTHHPFTAPKTARDVDLLLTDPLAVTADHYDLVLNGVELGGGSKRIHSAEIQKFIMKHVLEMSDERMSDFNHLFEALRAGCPPHAGFAIGFDRWVAVLTGKESVRDVIFFPKGKRGEDAMVGSPGMITKEQEEIYGLKSK
ncbi:hypothetical protein EYC84_006542 [Monilinia fructicola]|uniref:Aminoacyl-transfer RNA synthetases class-II family profile domain-containing protein n=1 Tax=Monilinia fructicola TaxID=38448 RepID=A0A5M9K873_MONFR|nr:hypothetical protein EYC84_006542 [Monilinia fructicola]